MTRKEMKINERNIKIREFIESDAFDNVTVIENYDAEFAYCYGSLEEIRKQDFSKVYRKYHQIVRGNYWQRKGTRLIINESDVKYVWKNRYIVLKKGGVFDIATGFFIIKKEFLKAKCLWEKKVKSHDIWESYQIPSFDEFGMNLSEYKSHKEIERILDMFYEDLYDLLESRDFEPSYNRNEFDFIIQVNSNNGDKFSIIGFNTSNPENLKISFRYNDNEYFDYELEKAYEKIKELLAKGDDRND